MAGYVGGSDYVFGANTAKGSNAYATGSNQNCGNVLTDRPTTRLHAPPGGASSISIGGPTTAQQVQANRQAGVLAPSPGGMGSSPGGGSRKSFGNNLHQSTPGLLPGSLGNEAPAPRAAPLSSYTSGGSGGGGGYSGGVVQDGGATANQGMMFGANTAKGSNAYANGANQNSGNFITDRSTTRLHAPPGGASSFSIGHMGGGSTSTVDPLTGKQSPKARSGPDPYTGRGTSSLASYVAAPASYSPAPAPAPAPAPTLASAPAQYQAPGQQQQTFGARVQGSSNDYQRSSAGNSYGGINGNGSQNTGNFLSDRPTSRVLAPPGGGSSITFG